MKNKGWTPLYGSTRTLENWIIPMYNDREVKKYVDIDGVIIRLLPDYRNGQLIGTGVNVRNEINNVFYFRGQIPESFLGKTARLSQKIISEDRHSFTVEQIIGVSHPTLLVSKEARNISSRYPKEGTECRTMIYAIGKFPKKDKDIPIMYKD